VTGERRQVERAQAGKQPVVPAPLDDVHLEPWRVGELQVEDLRAGDHPDAGGIVAAGQHVEAVQAQAQGGMVGAAHDPPGVGVRVDPSPPGQRLVGDP
jgi:hypothetical protein